MNYQGTLVGLMSSVGSIYNVQVDDSKCYLWKANVNAQFLGSGANVQYRWNGYLYELRLKQIKHNYFTGEIFSEGGNWGSVYLWKYSKEDELILKGGYTEEGVNYDIFIELRPSK